MSQTIDDILSSLPGTGGSRPSASSWSPEQLDTARKIYQIGRERNEPDDHIRAALSTGIVESGFKNLTGDKNLGAGNEAYGVFQQRPVSGWGSKQQVQNVDYAARKFYDAASKVQKYRSPGHLAAQVQRPRADLRGRYDQELPKADQLFEQFQGDDKPGPTIDDVLQKGIGDAGVSIGSGDLSDRNNSGIRQTSMGSVVQPSGPSIARVGNTTIPPQPEAPVNEFSNTPISTLGVGPGSTTVDGFSTIRPRTVTPEFSERDFRKYLVDQQIPRTQENLKKLRPAFQAMQMGDPESTDKFLAIPPQRTPTLSRALIPAGQPVTNGDLLWHARMNATTFAQLPKLKQQAVLRGVAAEAKADQARKSKGEQIPQPSLEQQNAFRAKYGLEPVTPNQQGFRESLQFPGQFDANTDQVVGRVKGQSRALANRVVSGVLNPLPQADRDTATKAAIRQQILEERAQAEGNMATRPQRGATYSQARLPDLTEEDLQAETERRFGEQPTEAERAQASQRIAGLEGQNYFERQWNEPYIASFVHKAQSLLGHSAKYSPIGEGALPQFLKQGMTTAGDWARSQAKIDDLVSNHDYEGDHGVMRQIGREGVKQAFSLVPMIVSSEATGIPFPYLMAGQSYIENESKPLNERLFAAGTAYLLGKAYETLPHVGVKGLQAVPGRIGKLATKYPGIASRVVGAAGFGGYGAGETTLRGGTAEQALVSGISQAIPGAALAGEPEGPEATRAPLVEGERTGLITPFSRKAQQVNAIADSLAEPQARRPIEVRKGTPNETARTNGNGGLSPADPRQLVRPEEIQVSQPGTQPQRPGESNLPDASGVQPVVSEAISGAGQARSLADDENAGQNQSAPVVPRETPQVAPKGKPNNQDLSASVPAKAEDALRDRAHDMVIDYSNTMRAKGYSVSGSDMEEMVNAVDLSQPNALEELQRKLQQDIDARPDNPRTQANLPRAPLPKNAKLTDFILDRIANAKTSGEVGLATFVDGTDAQWSNADHDRIQRAVDARMKDVPQDSQTEAEARWVKGLDPWGSKSEPSQVGEVSNKEVSPMGDVKDPVSAPRFEPITIPDKRGYGYKVIHPTVRPDTPKYQVAKFDENDTPTGHTGSDTLEGALRDSGYFDDDMKRASEYRGQLTKARKILQSNDVQMGEYAYASPLGPITMVRPDALKDAAISNVDRVGIIFTKAPLSLHDQESLELHPINSKSFDEFVKARTAKDYPGIQPTPPERQESVTPPSPDRRQADSPIPEGLDQRKGDRREDKATRKRVDQMTPEEMAIALHTSEITGGLNDRAYKDSTKKPIQAASDIDGLKYLNDHHNHTFGNAIIKAKADALAEANVEAYHLHGDEFASQFNTPEEARAGMGRANEILKNKEFTFELPDGSTKTVKGVGFSYETGSSYDEADIATDARKKANYAAGNTVRGERPPGLSESYSKGEQADQGEVVHHSELQSRDGAGRFNGPPEPQTIDDILTKEQSNATSTGEDKGNTPEELSGTGSREDLSTHNAEVREGQGRQAEGSDSAERIGAEQEPVQESKAATIDSELKKQIAPDRTITRQGSKFLAPDGTEFTGKGARRRAEEYAKQKSYEGATVKSYGGGLDKVLSVTPNSYGLFDYKVEAEDGSTRTHSTQLTDKDVVAWPDGEKEKLPPVREKAPQDKLAFGGGLADFYPGVQEFISEDIAPHGRSAMKFARAATGIFRTISSALKLNTAQPVIKNLGDDAYAGVIRAIHTGERKVEEFGAQRSKVFDANMNELRRQFDRLPGSEMADFNLTRGTPETPEGKKLQTDAIDRLKKSPNFASFDKLQKAVKDSSDSIWQYATDNGLDMNYFEDYFYGNYKNSEKVQKFLDYWKSTDRYLKDKTFPTIADAAGFGLELKNPNPITNLESEMSAVGRRVGLLKLREDLVAKKAPYAVETESLTDTEKKLLASSGWDVIHDPVFKGMKFEPDYARFANALLETSKIGRNPLLKVLQQTNRTLRQIKFFGSVFHMVNMLKASVADEAGSVADPRGYQKFGESFKAVDRTDPQYLDYVNLGGGHGYSAEADASGQLQRGLERLGRGNILGGVPRILSGIAQSPLIPGGPGFSHWMFSDYIPTLKYAKYEADVTKGETKLGRPLTDGEKIQIIKRNQNFYGEMNERLFGRSATATQALRIIFTAPGYGEGNFRTGGRAITGDLKSARFVASSLLTTVVASTLATRILTGHWPAVPRSRKDLRDLMKIQTGMEDAAGRPLTIDAATYDKDFYLQAGLLTGGYGTDTSPGEDLRRRVSGGESPAMQMLADTSQWIRTGKVLDWKGKEIINPNQTWGQKAKAVATEAKEIAQPIPFSTYNDARDKGFGVAASVAQGITGIRPASKYDPDAKGLLFQGIKQAGGAKVVTEMHRLGIERLDTTRRAKMEERDKKQTPLTDAQQKALANATNQYLNPTLDKLMSSPAYSKMTDEQKKDAIQEVIRDIKSNALEGFKGMTFKEKRALSQGAQQ